MAGANRGNVEKGVSISSGPRAFVQQLPLRRITSSHGGELACFVIKALGLEIARRVSKAKCPVVWTALQRLQVLCYPPLKWVQWCHPFDLLVKGMQVISRPLLVVSLVSILSDESDSGNHVSDETANSPAIGELGPETQNKGNGEASAESPESTEWLNRLYKELENQGFTLPERITREDLDRHYVNANGDFPTMVSLVKKTIRWRETFRFLSTEELESWSNYIFWHGMDVNLRHCLFVRLGLGCMSIPARDRALFTQALISQVEHGILNLMDEGNPRITVLVDCQGLSPLRFPMQTMGYCCNILKDHFPDVLGCMIIIHAPPVVRVIANTFIKVLKPSTRKKLRMEGEAYHKLLSGLFQTIPSYLGGPCTCTVCVKLDSGRVTNTRRPYVESSTSRIMDPDDDMLSVQPPHEYETIMDSQCSRTLRAAVIGCLIFLVLIAFLEGIYNPETRPFTGP